MFWRCAQKKHQTFFFQMKNTEIQGCRFGPYTFSETKPQMVPTDLNIGFQGSALIQGQIYNPEIS